MDSTVFFMYGDEIGTEQIRDNSNYYGLVGSIFRVDDLAVMKGAVQGYRDDNLAGAYGESEIHLYEIFNGQGRFRGLDLSQKLALLDPLYSTLGSLPFTIISVFINKGEFVRHHDPSMILDYAYTMLVERFDDYLMENGGKGLLRIDKTTPPSRTTLNPKDAQILGLINRIRRNGTLWRPPAESIVEEPHFVASHLRKGLQVADAAGYCINRRMNGLPHFDEYWSKIYPKFWTGGGDPAGYGLKIYP